MEHKNIHKCRFQESTSECSSHKCYPCLLLIFKSTQSFLFKSYEVCLCKFFRVQHHWQTDAAFPLAKNGKTDGSPTFQEECFSDSKCPVQNGPARLSVFTSTTWDSLRVTWIQETEQQLTKCHWCVLVSLGLWRTSLPWSYSERRDVGNTAIGILEMWEDIQKHQRGKSESSNSSCISL